MSGMLSRDWDALDYELGGRTECGVNAVAYVPPRRTGKTLYLCPKFFEDYKADEKARIILHEISHFVNTEDYEVTLPRKSGGTMTVPAYTETFCLHLAKQNRHKESLDRPAMTNADSVAFFCEIRKQTLIQTRV